MGVFSGLADLLGLSPQASLCGVGLIPLMVFFLERFKIKTPPTRNAASARYIKIVVSVIINTP